MSGYNMVAVSLPISITYSTWGNFGQHVLSTIMLPVGDSLIALDVVKATQYSGVAVVQVGGYRITIDVANRDSRRNFHRSGRVLSIEPWPPFVVLYHRYRSAKNVRHDFIVVYPDGREQYVKPVVEVVGNYKRFYLPVGGKYYLLGERPLEGGHD